MQPIDSAAIAVFDEQERQRETMRRLLMLMRKGYDPKIDDPFDRELRLETTDGRSVRLNPVGMIDGVDFVNHEGKRHITIFNDSADDARCFDDFLAMVPNPEHDRLTRERRTFFWMKFWSRFGVVFKLALLVAIVLWVRSCVS